jgi:hypothetical protein
MNRDDWSPKPIETEYAGCRFRSRLEARWAVAFDALGERWLYEPQGFNLRTPHGLPVQYLPDFYLPERQVWVEVKGSNDALIEAWTLLLTASTRELGLPVDPEGTPPPKGTDLPRLLVLGPVPKSDERTAANRCGFLLLGLLDGEVVVRHSDLLGNYTRPIFDMRDDDGCPALVGNGLHLEGHSVDVVRADMKAVAQESARIYYALGCARAARFEHGETPRFPVWRAGDPSPGGDSDVA